MITIYYNDYDYVDYSILEFWFILIMSLIVVLISVAFF